MMLDSRAGRWNTAVRKVAMALAVTAALMLPQAVLAADARVLTIAVIGSDGAGTAKLRSLVQEARRNLGFTADDVGIIWAEAGRMAANDLKRLGITKSALPCLCVAGGSADVPLEGVAGDPPAVLRNCADTPQTAEMIVGLWAQLAHKPLPPGFEASSEMFRPGKIVLMVVGKVPDDNAAAIDVRETRDALKIDAAKIPVLFTTFRDGLFVEQDFSRLGVDEAALPCACLVRVSPESRPEAVVDTPVRNLKDARESGYTLLAAWARENGLDLEATRINEESKKSRSPGIVGAWYTAGRSGLSTFEAQLTTREDGTYTVQALRVNGKGNTFASASEGKYYVVDASTPSFIFQRTSGNLRYSLDKVTCYLSQDGNSLYENNPDKPTCVFHRK